MNLPSTTLLCGDNLKLMRQMKPECFDMVYVDPPFFTKRKLESVSSNESDRHAFNDTWDSLESYIDWMRIRMQVVFSLLKSTGALFFHCDWHAGHYLKVMLDDIFGRKQFRNEIIWCYRTGGASKRRWSRKHDNIFFYSKSNRYTFNQTKERIYYKKRLFINSQDEKGRLYADVNPIDWWEMPAVFNMSKECLNYPTQKPIALLTKMILATTNEAETILDPFCGSGTTLVAGLKHKRNVIGIDASEGAITLTQKRLEAIGIADIKRVLDSSFVSESSFADSLISADKDA